jgi:hypothetical protein
MPPTANGAIFSRSLGGTKVCLAAGLALGGTDHGAQHPHALRVRVERGSVEIRHGVFPCGLAGFVSSGVPI